MHPVQSKDSGFVLVALIMVLIPLIALVGGLTMTMRTNTSAMLDAVGREKAFQASECGVADMIYKLKTAGLAGGHTYNRDLGLGMSYSASVVEVTTPAPIGFDVTISGKYARYTRRIAIELRLSGPSGPVSIPANSIQSAMTFYNPSPQIQIDFKGNGFITGLDTNLDLTSGPGPDVFGLAIQHPRNVGHLTSDLSVDQPGRITGSPSQYGVSTSSLDLTALVNDVKDNRDINLSDSYENTDWTGTDFQLLYRNGDLQLSKTVEGKGVLVVTGKLQVSDNFYFDGIVIVLGDVQMDGSGGLIRITGGIIQGPASNQTQFADNIHVRYSSEAIQKAAGSGEYEVAGWRELGS